MAISVATVCLTLSWSLSCELDTTIIPHACILHCVPFASVQYRGKHNSQQNACTELPTRAPQALHSKGPVEWSSSVCHFSSVACSCLQASKPASAPITNYFSQQKHPAAISKVLVRKDDTDATELAQPSRPSKGLASMAQPLQAAQNSPPWANPAPPGRSGRVNLSAEPEPDLMALSRASLSESVSRRLPAETAAGSSHDAQLEQLLAYTASQELELQLPHASRVRQQDKSQAETPLQRHLTVLYNTQIESHQVEEPCVSSRTGLDDSHAMASQFVGSPRAGQLDDQFREGRVEGMSNAGHCQATPNALTAQLDVHTTPKRPTAANSEDVIVISPESQVQDDVEVDLLSPSPAKR